MFEPAYSRFYIRREMKAGPNIGIRPSYTAVAASVVSAIAISLIPEAALAASGDPVSTTGAAQASVVEGISVSGAENLRFGAFAAPKSDGTLTVDASGTVLATAGMAGGADLAQPSGARGPASFHLLGSPDRIVFIQLPSSTDLIGDGATMRIDGLNSNQTGGSIKLDNSGYFKLLVGGRLNVSAGQPSGLYSGSFEVTVLYE